MKKVIIILFAVLAVSLCACQPTPNDAIVIPKENTEKEVIKSSEENNVIDFSYEVPEHVTDRFTVHEDLLDIVIDANVFMPKLDKVPVAKITTDYFTQDRAEELLEYFMQGGILVDEKVFTKADYDEMIVEAKREYAKRESDEPIHIDGVEWIEYLTQEREKAPDEYIPTKITDYNIFQEDGLRGRVQVEDEIIGGIGIKENRISFTANRYYESTQYLSRNEDGETIIEFPYDEFDFPIETAKEYAQSALNEMGIENMAVVEDYKVVFLDEKSKETISYGYEMTLVREFGGMVPKIIDGYNLSNIDTFDVAPPVELESITMVVDEHGDIARFSWNNPMKIVDTLTEHVDILPFDKIMDRLKESVSIEFGYMAGYGSDVLNTKNIYDISLCLNYLPIKNNPNEFMYAPCWVFTYKDIPEYTQEQIEYFESIGAKIIGWDEMGDEYIIFSAVDGASVAGCPRAVYDKMMGFDSE